MLFKHTNTDNGRIQNLTSDQEIALKQVWAHFLRYWGYEIDMTKEELRNPNCFVASASSHAVSMSSFSHRIRHSIHSLSSLDDEKRMKPEKRRRRSTFSRKLSHSSTSDGHTSKRLEHMFELQNEEYVPSNEVSVMTCHIFMHYYHALFERTFSMHTELDDQDSHLEHGSFQSFTTAAAPSMEEGVDSLPTKSHGHGTGGHAHAHGTQHNAVFPPAEMIQVTPKPLTFSFMRHGDVHAIHNCFFTMGRQYIFDDNVMRFVRSRRNNCKRASRMLFTSLRWRSEHFPGTKWLLEGDAASYANNTNPGLIKHFTAEKCSIVGADLHGNPCLAFVACKHFQTDSTPEEAQRYLVLLLEWVGLSLQEVSKSVDRVTVLFDLTGFSLKNGDYHAIKFLFDMLGAHYPDVIDSLIVYNAPWIFSSWWSTVKNWVDPILARRIHFTKKTSQVQHYVDIDTIPVSMGGKNTHEAKYHPPEVKDTYPPKRRDANYTRLARERDELMMRLIDTTRRWIHSTNPHVSAKYLQDKIDLNIELSHNYVALDPYIRCRGVFDRDGSLVLRC